MTSFAAPVIPRLYVSATLLVRPHSGGMQKAHIAPALPMRILFRI